MLFEYTAIQENSQIIKGEFEANDLAGVLKYLTGKRLKPISVKAVGGGVARKVSLFRGRINLMDKVFIFRYLTLMLGLGTNLLQAIDILIQDFDKPAVKSFLSEVRANLEKGSPFFLAFENHPKVFSSVTVNLIKAGETSGNLEQVFGEITVSLIKEKDLQDQIKNATIYPAILAIISFLILVFLVTFAMPRIASVFMQGGFDPPLFSKIVFSVGLFFGKIWWLVLLVFAGLIFGVFYAYRNLLGFRKFIWSILSGVPVISDIVNKRAVQRFASTTSSLIKAGIPITDSLEISADAAGHVEMQQSLRRVAREGLTKGLTLGEAFRREPFFPKVVTNLIAVSEKSGRIEDVLETLSDFYAKEIDNSLKRAMSMLEPVMLIVIGGIIGTIAISIIIPIYQLTTQF